MAFNKLIEAGRKKEIFPLHGDGSQIRDFTFVGDVVEANKLAAFADLSESSIFNIGGGSPISMNETIVMLEEIMSLKIRTNFTPLGPGNPMVTTADCNMANANLGWKPQTDIYTGLIAQVAWQSEQA
jgi:UDP-glucose 4-epimerase